MTYCYDVHGALVQSNHCIVGARPGGLPESPVVRLCVSRFECAPGPVKRYAPIDLLVRDHDVNGEEILRSDTVWPGSRMCVRMAASGRWIELDWWDSDTADFTRLDRVLRPYFLGNLIGSALRLSGEVVLHGNAIQRGKQTVAWVGRKGVGKSTLAAAFVASGGQLLSDDQVVVRRDSSGWLPSRGLSIIRLWPRSAAVASSAEGVTFIPHRHPRIKGVIEVPDQAMGWTPAPLAAICVLGPRLTGESRPSIRLLRAGARLHAVHPHRLAARSLPLSENQARAEFQQFGKLTAEVPVFEVRLPDALGTLREAVERLWQALTPGAE